MSFASLAHAMKFHKSSLKTGYSSRQNSVLNLGENQAEAKILWRHNGRVFGGPKSHFFSSSLRQEVKSWSLNGFLGRQK